MFALIFPWVSFYLSAEPLNQSPSFIHPPGVRLLLGPPPHQSPPPDHLPPPTPQLTPRTFPTFFRHTPHYRPLLCSPSHPSALLRGATPRGAGGSGKSDDVLRLRDVGVERTKALRVRARVDFKRWGFVRLEGEDQQAMTLSPTSASAALPTRPKPTSTRYSSGGEGSRFSHVDEKLAARRSRRNLPSSSKKTDEDGAKGDAGCDAGVGKVAEGTWFLVLIRRGLEGLEGAPGVEQ